MSVAPRIILLDIDGTLLGNVVPVVCEWELLRQFDKGKLKNFKENFRKSLEQGLLRTGISEFLDYLKTDNSHTEIFIYTAGDKSWVNVIIPMIEVYTHFKFNRPLFTRDHCINIKNLGVMKSIARVAPMIVRKLHSQYPYLTKAAVMESAVLIDNSHVIIPQEKYRMIKVPTYNYIYHYDVLKYVEHRVVVEHYLEICKVLVAYGLYPDNKELSSCQMSYDSFMAYYYMHLAGLYKKQHKESMSQGSKSDNTFHTIIKAMIKYKHFAFTDKTVRHLNYVLGQKGT